MIDAGNKNKIVFAHHPVLDTLPGQYIVEGHDELMALLAAYGVIAYLSGHRHMRSIAYVVNGITHVDGGATSYGVGGTRMMYFERCAAGHLHMRNISARAPFATMADAKPVEIALA